jgi:hypothetical protein
VSLTLALLDAGTNCERDGATAEITLKSGVQFKGKLKRPTDPIITVHMETELDGWTTIDFNEVAAVRTYVEPRSRW